MKRALILLPILATSLVGCNALNDNPTDATKMQEIRHKEAADRQNYNPSTTPPPTK